MGTGADETKNRTSARLSLIRIRRVWYFLARVYRSAKPKKQILIVAGAVLGVCGTKSTEYIITKFDLFHNKTSFNYQSKEALCEANSSKCLSHPQVTIANIGHTDGRDVVFAVAAPSGCTLDLKSTETLPPDEATIMELQETRASDKFSPGHDAAIWHVGNFPAQSRLTLTYETECHGSIRSVKLAVRVSEKNATPREIGRSRSMAGPSTLFTLDNLSGKDGAHDLSSIGNRSVSNTAGSDPIFRIVTPSFGIGFVENTKNGSARYNMHQDATGIVNGVAGRNSSIGTISRSGFYTSPNSSPNPNSVTISAGSLSHNGDSIRRFGWKAQNKSLLIFGGESANVEMGVTNEVFRHDTVPGYDNQSPGPDDDASTWSLIENFAAFMRLTESDAQCDPQKALKSNGSGESDCYAFNSTAPGDAISGINEQDIDSKTEFGFFLTALSRFGQYNSGTELDDKCFICHITSPQSSYSARLQNAVFSSSAGGADGDQFRTAPLWRLGQRIFLLRDEPVGIRLLNDGGARLTLESAIDGEGSAQGPCTAEIDSKKRLSVKITRNGGANLVAETANQMCNFGTISASQQQELIDFLRSL